MSLVSDFMVNSGLKILYGISMEFMECLNKDAYKEKEKRTLPVHQGRVVLILPAPTCLILSMSFMDSMMI